MINVLEAGLPRGRSNDDPIRSTISGLGPGGSEKVTISRRSSADIALPRVNGGPEVGAQLNLNTRPVRFMIIGNGLNRNATRTLALLPKFPHAMVRGLDMAAIPMRIE